MYFKVKHNLFGIEDTKYPYTNRSYASASFNQPYISDSDSMYSTTRKVYYGKNRRENVSLIRAMEVLRGKSEITLRNTEKRKVTLNKLFII